MRTIIASILLAAAAVYAADPAPYPLAIDSQTGTPPDLKMYQANARTIRVSFSDGGTALNASNCTPFLYWAESEYSTAIVTSSWSWVTQSLGVVDMTWSPSALNTNGVGWIYGVGLRNNDDNPIVYQHGTFEIVADPYATGAASITWSSNVNLSLYTYTGTIPSVNVGAGFFHTPTNTPAAAGYIPAASDTTGYNVYWTSAGSGDMIRSTYDPAGTNMQLVGTNDSRLTDARTPTAHTQWTAGTGLTNAGTGQNPTGALNAASVASLSKADTASQPGHTQAANSITNAGDIITHNVSEFATSAQGIAGTNAQARVGVLETNTATLTQGSHADTAFSWGNHSTNGYVTASVTNHLASTNWVDTSYYPRANPSNYVTANVTNNLASTNWVDTDYYPRSNPSNYVDASVTNGLVGVELDPTWGQYSNQVASTNWVDTGYYPRNNPSNFVITETDPNWALVSNGICSLTNRILRYSSNGVFLASYTNLYTALNTAEVSYSTGDVFQIGPGTYGGLGSFTEKYLYAFDFTLIGSGKDQTKITLALYPGGPLHLRNLTSGAISAYAATTLYFDNVISGTMNVNNNSHTNVSIYAENTTFGGSGITNYDGNIPVPVYYKFCTFSNSTFRPSTGFTLVKQDIYLTNATGWSYIPAVTNVLPDASNQYDVGSTAFPFRSGYFSTNSLYLGDYEVTKVKAQEWDSFTNIVAQGTDGWNAAWAWVSGSSNGPVYKWYTNDAYQDTNVAQAVMALYPTGTWNSALQDGSITTNGLFTTRASGFAGTEYVNADWVRGLLQIGVPWYMSSNSQSVGYAPGTAQIGNTAMDTNSFRSSVAVTNTGSYYIHSMITTSRVNGTLLGPSSLEIYCGRLGTGPVGNQNMSIAVELYYTYDSTNLYGNWAPAAQAIPSGGGVTNKMLFTIPFPNTDVTNALVVYRIKQSSSANTTNFFVCGGNGYASFAQLRQPSSETLGIRGATNMAHNAEGVASWYNTTNRTFYEAEAASFTPYQISWATNLTYDHTIRIQELWVTNGSGTTLNFATNSSTNLTWSSRLDFWTGTNSLTLNTNTFLVDTNDTIGAGVTAFLARIGTNKVNAVLIDKAKGATYFRLYGLNF